MKESDNRSVRERVKEIIKPRMSRSARIAGLKLDTSRIPEPPSTSVPGTVSKIVPPRLDQPEKAQIAVGDGNKKRSIRVENALVDEHGDDVVLKKGEHVDVTVAARKQRRG
jgi:hypothetical protein